MIPNTLSNTVSDPHLSFRLRDQYKEAITTIDGPGKASRRNFAKKTRKIDEFVRDPALKVVENPKLYRILPSDGWVRERRCLKRPKYFSRIQMITFLVAEQG